MINNALKTDPTRTLTLRKSFEAQMVRRFKVIRSAIIEAIEVDDIFGLTPRSHKIEVLERLEPRKFEFVSSDRKINGFMSWLEEMVEKNILTLTIRPDMRTGTVPWTNMYIQSAYQKGLSRARAELRAKGYKVPTAAGVVPGSGDSIGAAFNQPFHADRVAIAYTRTYDGLKGITGAMDQQISRVLAEGLAEGRGALDISRKIIDRVTGFPGLNGMSALTRARMLARTEIINAHHQATINEYEQWGVTGVSVQAEWLTAGFGVCPECVKLSHGGDIKPGIYSLDKIRGMIPVHPNCRCCAIPVVKETI